MTHLTSPSRTLEQPDDIANALWASFMSKIRGDEYVPPEDIAVPEGWSKDLAIGCEHASYVLAIAYLNQSQWFNA